jgi:hypothetical protein
LNLNNQPLFQQFTEFRCHDCGGNVGFRSRRRTFSERYILPALFLQPVRCAECFRRDYRLISMQVRERMPEVAHKPVASIAGPPAARGRNIA